MGLALLFLQVEFETAALLDQLMRRGNLMITSAHILFPGNLLGFLLNKFHG